MLENLSPEQEALQHIVAQEWIDLFFDTREINKDKFEAGVAWLYKTLLKLPAPNIVYCDSVRDALDKICDYNEVKQPERDEYKKSISSLYSAHISNPHASYWVAFYDFFTRIGVLNHADFNSYKEIVSSGVFTAYEFEKVVFAVHPPVKVNHIGNTIHSTEGMSIEMRDGTGYYHILGRPISQKNFLAIKNKTYTFEDFMNETNEEVKSVCLAAIQEIHGNEYFVHFLSKNLKEVDTYVDKKADKYLVGTTGGMNVGVYTLFSGSVNNTELNYVRCYCPSTERMFFLGTESEYKTAKDAIASLCRIPHKLKIGTHIKHINRQGERFSLVLTEQGKDLAKNLTEDDFSQTRPLTGEEYFSHILYEY